MSYMDSDYSKITQLLQLAAGGDRNAVEQLSVAVYAELHRLAVAKMAKERRDHTWQPTALVHDIFMKLMKQSRATWSCRKQFYITAANAMRRLLVDHARRSNAKKRGGGETPRPLDEGLDVADAQDDTLSIDLDEALTRLAKFDSIGAQIVEMNFFGGTTFDDIAEMLAMSKTTVENRWYAARDWLYRELHPEATNP